MINIVITAGGTVENIDEVRKITNTSTGKLGACICDEIIKHFNEKEKYLIHYITTKNSILPELINNNVKIYNITDTKSLENLIKEIVKNNKIDFFIHSMAVSDFHCDSVLDIDSLGEEIYKNIRGNMTKELFAEIFKEQLNKIDLNLLTNKKISSNSDKLILLKRNKKIISMIKEMDSRIFLVGFKLLKDVEEKKLIEAGNKLANENKCNLVLANDLSNIDVNKHRAILIKNEKIIKRFNSKEEIAIGLVRELFKGGL